jgi:hypothetical protein
MSVSSAFITIFQQRLKQWSYNVAVSLGLVSGVSNNTKFGDSVAQTGLHTVWGGSDTAQKIYVFPPDAGEAAAITSSVGATDDGVQVKFFTLDATGAEVDPQIVTLNNAAPPTVTARAFLRAKVVGATEAQGNISAIGVPGPNNLYIYIRISDQQTSQIPFMVPLGKVGVIKGFIFTISKAIGSDMNAQFKVKAKTPGDVFNVVRTLGAQRSGSSSLTYESPVPLVFPALTQITVEALPSAAADIAVTISYELVDEALVGPDLLAEIS